MPKPAIVIELPLSKKERLKKFARELRERMTPAEVALWQQLQGRKILGVRFRRQKPALGFIPDFSCAKPKLCIEVDGGYHLEPAQQEYDARRDEIFRYRNYVVLRFTNEQVLTDMESVLDQIRYTVQEGLDQEAEKQERRSARLQYS